MYFSRSFKHTRQSKGKKKEKKSTMSDTNCSVCRAAFPCDYSEQDKEFHRTACCQSMDNCMKPATMLPAAANIAKALQEAKKCDDNEKN